MKKILLPALAAMLALALSSCTREEPETQPEELVEMSFSASLEDDETKALLSGTKVFWQEGDIIAIYDGGAIRQFSLVKGAGTASGVFYGKAASSATTFYAAYPYSAAVLKDKTLRAYIPDSQSAVSAAADPSALVMTASAARGSVLKFSNSVSLLKFTVPAGVTKVTVSAPDGGALAGEASVCAQVSLSGKAGTFYAAVNPGSYSGFRVFMHTSSAVYYKETAKTLTATRNKIVNLGSLALTQTAVPITTAAELKSFLSSATASDTRKAVLFNDISMSGVSFSSASDFAGDFDGLGHTISGLSGGNPLFTLCHAAVRNLSLSGSMTTTLATFGALAGKNYGSLSNVRSAVAIYKSLTAATTGTIMMGALAGYNYGAMTGCSNTAAVKLNSTSSIKAAGVGGLAGYSSGPMSGCSNSGNITLLALYGTGRATVGSLTNVSANVAGLAAVCDSGFSASSCTNSGTVTFKLTAIENTPSSYNRACIGGIVGASYGNLDYCTNTGMVSAQCTTTSRAAFADQECVLCVGGISAAPWGQPDLGDKTSISRCTNSGDIYYTSDASKSNSAVGGVVGWPNQEKSGTTNKVENCSNSGNLITGGAGLVRVGGVMGGSGNIASCSNSGRVCIRGGSDSCLIGGVCGFRTQSHTMTGCSNTGDVYSYASNISGVGGLIGGHGNVAMTTCQGCSVNCSVSTGASSNTGAGMVVGYWNGVSKQVVVGTAASPVSVSGSISFNGRGYSIHKGNYTTYLCGTSNAADTHTINASCTTAAPADYTVNGYVRYSDGKPAQGVSVSDGFKVVVTDANGYYSLKACSDTWYIYISFPEDAKLGKNASTGLAPFFRTYNKSVQRYDFTLTRQTVENEFVIFAMGDPECHYKTRETQTTPDVDRFKNESVPAINAEIAAQTLPCYGITLGDMVYSERSRDSSPGLSTMRSNMQLLNMPVFHNFGNHDYTYFYGTSNKLTPDETSSTLYLKAQRSYESVFGPVNYSFNRGSVHFICMRNVNFDSDTSADLYHGGLTDAQLSWLAADLANVPKTKMVVLCVHIPFFLYRDETGAGVDEAVSLLAQYQNPRIFSGHTHYHRFFSSLKGTQVKEQTFSTVCGQFWWSNISGDGNPNGYTVLKFKGTEIQDEYFKGVNKGMNSKDYQIRMYKGNLKTGGSYAWFKFPYDANTLMINVFNGDSRWVVNVYENGTLSGRATILYAYWYSWDSVSPGQTYTPPSDSNGDWWAMGYHIGVVGRGTSSTAYYTNQFHMFKYTLKNPGSTVKVTATDPYGNTYTCTELWSTDCSYPSYIVAGAN